VPHSTRGVQLPHQPLPPAVVEQPESMPGSRVGLPALSMLGSFDNSMLEDVANKTFTTDPDKFGLFRVYPHCPCHNPDAQSNVRSVSDAPGLAGAVPEANTVWYTGMTKLLLNLTPSNLYAPLTSPSIYQLLSWFYCYNQPSLAGLDNLVKNVILHKDFDVNDPAIANFSASRKCGRLDSTLDEADGWNTAPIEIMVPIPGLSGMERTDNHVYTVRGACWWSIVEVMKTYFAQALMNTLHLTPFKIFRMGPFEPEPVHSEIYNSAAMYDEYVRVQDNQKNKTSLKIVIVAIMLWSDSTQLAQFGTASLWPIYLFFGNISKWIRGKPTLFSAQHLAYLPKVRNAS
jgi:hypothetical protein